MTEPLASDREVILFDNAGVGRSTGEVPTTIAGMAHHAGAFLEALGIKTCDVLGYSLGGMVALQMAQDLPSIFRRMILVGELRAVFVSIAFSNMRASRKGAIQ